MARHAALLALLVGITMFAGMQAVPTIYRRIVPTGAWPPWPGACAGAAGCCARFLPRFARL